MKGRRIIETKVKDLLEVRYDRLFHDLFNENEMDTIEWSVMQILNAKYEDIHKKVTVQNIRLPNTYKEEKGKYVDLIVDFKGEKIIIELNNYFLGNYMKNLLYAFNIITNHYNVGSDNNDFYNKRVKVILVNLNWFSTTKMANQVSPKEENILLYPESIHKEDNFLLKIININLVFYKKLCYNEVNQWDKLWKLLTIDNQEEMTAFTKNEKMLKHYQKKLHNLSTNNEYKETIMNEDIIKNVDREVYFFAGKDEGISEMIKNMHQKGISLEIISECANLSIEEIRNILKNQTNDN